MKSTKLRLIAIGLTMGPLAAHAGSLAGAWSGVGVPDPTSTQAPYDQLATLVLTTPVPSDSTGDFSLLWYGQRDLHKERPLLPPS